MSKMRRIKNKMLSVRISEDVEAKLYWLCLTYNLNKSELINGVVLRLYSKLYNKITEKEEKR